MLNMLVIILVLYILLNLKDSFKHGLGITLALAIPSGNINDNICGNELTVDTRILMLYTGTG